jgi:hypothetical protein
MAGGSKGAEYMRRRRAEGKAWDQRPENLERKRQRQREYWHRPRGGWLKRRKRDLAGQRTRAERDLRLLEEERVRLEQRIQEETS